MLQKKTHQRKASFGYSKSSSQLSSSSLPGFSSQTTWYLMGSNTDFPQVSLSLTPRTRSQLRWDISSLLSSSNCRLRLVWLLITSRTLISWLILSHVIGILQRMIRQSILEKKKNCFLSKQQLGHAVTLQCFTIAFWKDLCTCVTQKWIWRNSVHWEKREVWGWCSHVSNFHPHSCQLQLPNSVSSYIQQTGKLIIYLSSTPCCEGIKGRV